MRPPGAVLVAALLLAAGAAAPAALAIPQQTSASFVERLPQEWRDAVALLTLSEAEHQQFAALSDEALRQALVRPLSKEPRADDFLRTRLTLDPSPRVRTAIVQAITSDARWLALPGVSALLQTAAAADPDVNVSLTALERLRLGAMRGLTNLLDARLARAQRDGDIGSLARLQEERERWITFERGTMLPAFLRDAPEPFTVLPADRRVRVLAFGDFGNGSHDQKTVAGTIARYHRDRPLDLAITLGDNFYSRGMESPADPRWKTWWEDLYAPLGITFYAALGNHDWGHPDSPAAEILYAPPSRSWRMPASYYTFVAGPIQFFALDTQNVAVSDRQLQWLDRELARSEAVWKVVYGHHPIYSGGSYEDRPDLIARLLPLLRGRADVYICGHDHNLQAIRPDGGVRFYVAGGGGAGLYTLRPYERSLFASRSNGFAVIDADATRLTVSLVDTTGTHVYEDTIRRSSTR